ncbi:iron-containing redox enzyme family protein [Streptomyces sp. NPDC002742]|jgi:hypothetical protein|uniref:iron-containing redox enzyme family protein n=1 Tax=unclassified Streptomyces TaxID=2593676 RepID=UPI003427A837
MIAESTRLRLKIETVVPALAAAAQRAWAPPSPERYREFLAVCHMAIRATVPLLEFAVAECVARGRDDAVAARLAGYYRDQIAEERGHDTELLADFTAAGGDAALLLRRIPRPEIASLVGAQYYWTRHGHPVALIGHIAVLEGYPPPPVLLGRIRRSTGLPAAAFRTLARHAELDQLHRTALAELLDSLPLEDRHRSAAGIAALHSVQMLVATLDRLAGQVEGEDRTA